ncbi:MAG: alpha/beta hydrolase [Myxococcaceae bacterium]|nr:alpha/beta hydrolase [Myxococcaceae bacterium]MCA3012715.1 alpha/beta hydrolase [Myxococcaceae bacterium]
MTDLRLSFRFFCWLADRLAPPVEVVGAAQARAALRRSTGTSNPILGRPPALAGSHDMQLAGVPVRRYTPTNPRDGVIVAFHGGGWTVGDLDSHDTITRFLCSASGHEVVAVDYRLAPEHPFPAAIDDALAVTRALVARGRVVVAGDSAGGHLAAVVARRLAQEPNLVGQLLVYPVTSCAAEAPSYERFAQGFFLTRASMRFYKDAFLPPGLDRAHPDASPLGAPACRTAPAYVLLASHDVLHDEGVAYARQLERDGAVVTLDVVPGVVHGFFSLQGFSVAREALARTARWLQATLG